MKTIATLALGTCMTLAFAGAGFAQGMTKMSDSDKTMMTKCKGMSDSMMKADKDCMAMMKKYPQDMASPSSMDKSTSKTK